MKYGEWFHFSDAQHKKKQEILKTVFRRKRGALNPFIKKEIKFEIYIPSI